MKQPYIGNKKINKLYKGNELWCNWIGTDVPVSPPEPSGNLPPITDGLLLYLDGNDLVENGTTWTDRVTGTTYTLTNFNVGNVQQGRIIMNVNSGFTIPSLNFKSMIFGFNRGTINSQVNVIVDDGRKCRFCMRYHDLYPYEANLSGAKVNGSEIYTSSFLGLFINTIQKNDMTEYVNNIYLSFNNNTHTNILINKQNTNNDARYYYFLFYDRDLTEDEINQIFIYLNREGLPYE